MGKTFEQKLDEARESVSAISPLDANQRKMKDPSVIFIDPRDRNDISATTGIIPGAVNISLSELSEKPTDELPVALADSRCTIITACQAGPMGALAAHALQKRGYSNVQFMEGGTQGWLDAGFSTQ